MDDGWAALVVLLLGDPHLLEGGEGSQDGASDPDGVLPLRGSNDLDLDGGGSDGSEMTPWEGNFFIILTSKCSTQKGRMKRTLQYS